MCVCVCVCESIRKRTFHINGKPNIHLPSASATNRMRHKDNF